MKTGSINYIIFDEDNEIPFFQDMQFSRNVPNDVMFFCTELNDRYAVFVGDQYGIQDKHNLPGSYGNGAIYIDITNLPYDVFEWCKKNIYTATETTKEQQQTTQPEQ